jgi:5'-deoxynucleotidase YfbR-like HD superfamily hydrolase
MNDFRKLYEAGQVKRYHTQTTIKDQNLAEHQWGVAMIVNHVYPQGYVLLMAALTHDLAECDTGDIPYTAKRDNYNLKSASDDAEEAFNFQHNLVQGLNREEHKILAWADMFECFLFARRETWLGNQTMQKVVSTARAALLAMGHPNEKAAQLFREYHG